MKFRYEDHNLDGQGFVRTRVYDLPVLHEGYWRNVTDIPCPVCSTGMIRWHEAGYVAGYRICESCGRHFLAKGDISSPRLLRVGKRSGR